MRFVRRSWTTGRSPRLIVAAVVALAATLGVSAAPATAGAATARDSERAQTEQLDQRDRTLVERAIDAPFTDVGIGPVSSTVKFWEARVAEHPEDTLSLTRLASAIMGTARDTGDLSLYGRAEAVLRDALAVNPSDNGAVLALASARAANHDFATSMTLAEQVLSRDPASKVARIAIADDNFELGNYEVAEQQLLELVNSLPDSVALSGRQAKLAAISGDNGSAVRFAAQALLGAADLDLRRSEAAFYRFQLAFFLYQGGHAELALDALRAGLSIDPGHLPSAELEAKVLVSLGRLSRAAAAYEAIIPRTPAADLHGSLANVYRALGRDQEADAQIKAGLDLGYVSLGTYPAERRHLAAFFADFDPPTAVIAAAADFETRRDVGAYDALAWAHFRNGDPAAAARYLDGALAQGTRSAPLLYHAGMIEHANGRARAARLHLAQSLRLDPRFDPIHAPIAKTTLAELRANA